MEVFNGQVTIELPEGYEPWDIKEPGAGEDSGPLISLLSNGSDPDTASLPVPSPGLSFRSIRNKNTRILLRTGTRKSWKKGSICIPRSLPAAFRFLKTTT